MSSNKCWHCLIAAALIALTLAVYWQVHAFDFVNFDDGVYVEQNLRIKSGLTSENLAWAFKTTYFSNWHPLVWLSYLLDAHLFGIDAAAFHLTNVVFHVINVLLLFALMSQMTKQIWKSAFVAAVFAVHPLNVEAVAWISARKDGICTCFGLLSLIAYVWYVCRPSWYRLLASTTAFALSLMSKQMLVTLPCLLCLLDYWPLQRKFSKRILQEKIPFLLLAIVACVIAYASHRQAGSIGLSAETSVGLRCLNAVVAYGLYLGKTFWPQDLAVFYPHPGQSLSMLSVAGSAVLLAAITTAVLTHTRQHPYALVGWLWYLGTLVPVIGLVQVGGQQMADRYLYIPMIGLTIGLCWLVPDILPKRPGCDYLVAGLALTSIVLLTTVGWKQTRYWRNSITLFRHTSQVTQNNDVAHNNLGLALKEEGLLSEAFEELSAAIRINPQNAKAHDNLGLVLSDSGRKKEALAQFQESLRIDPQDAKTYNNLGNLLQETQQADAAIEYLRTAIELDPRFADAYNNLGNALKSLRRYDEAIYQFQRALELDSLNPTYHSNLGVALYERGRLDEALSHFETALRLNPRYALVHLNMGVALYKNGRFDEAIHSFQEARAIDPDNAFARRFEAAAYNALGVYLEAQGQRNAAIEKFRAAVRVQPDFLDAKRNLDRALGGT